MEIIIIITGIVAVVVAFCLTALAAMWPEMEHRRAETSRILTDLDFKLNKFDTAPYFSLKERTDVKRNTPLWFKIFNTVLENRFYHIEKPGNAKMFAAARYDLKNYRQWCERKAELKAQAAAKAKEEARFAAKTDDTVYIIHSLDKI